MLYVTPQCSELTVTIAIALLMGALPKMTECGYVHTHLHCIIYIHVRSRYNGAQDMYIPVLFIPTSSTALTTH